MGNHLRLFRDKNEKKYIILKKIIYNSCVCRKFFVILQQNRRNSIMSEMKDIKRASRKVFKNHFLREV